MMVARVFPIRRIENMRPDRPDFPPGLPELGDVHRERTRLGSSLRTSGHFFSHCHERFHDHLHDHGPGRGPRGHQRLWLRHRWRRFSGVHLRRRLFLWFGATIVLTTLVIAYLAHVPRFGPTRPHIPGVAFLVIPVVILWAAAGKVARRIARPLDELVRVAQDIGAGRLDARARLHCGGIDEIAELSRAVNDMAARIEGQLRDQRELLAGVSHEIRTPLARLRLLVEIGRERGSGTTNLDEIERELVEIDALVGELLASARLDFSAVTPMPLDAREVAARAAERAGVSADRVIADATDLGFVGDPTLLARALANLLQNASVHGGGVDVLRVGGRANTIDFTILDRGPGFAPGEEGRVFDRFYRPPPVSGDPEGAGSDGRLKSDRAPSGIPARADGLGLGLALVRRIADAHGGTVVACNRPPGVGGAEVSLSIPRVPGRPA
jgi:two-component system OmpR family sensor kinase